MIESAEADFHIHRYDDDSQRFANRSGSNTNGCNIETKRQTLCPIRQISIPSACAHLNMSNLYKENLGKQSSSCVEWIQLFFEALNLNKLSTYKIEYEVKSRKTYDKESKQYRDKALKVKKTKELY